LSGQTGLPTGGESDRRDRAGRQKPSVRLTPPVSVPDAGGRARKIIRGPVAGDPGRQVVGFNKEKERDDVKGLTVDETLTPQQVAGRFRSVRFEPDVLVYVGGTEGAENIQLVYRKRKKPGDNKTGDYE